MAQDSAFILSILAIVLNITVMVISLIFMIEHRGFSALTVALCIYFILFAILMSIVEAASMDKLGGIRSKIFNNVNMLQKYQGKALFYLLWGILVICFHAGWRGHGYHIVWGVTGALLIVIAIVNMILGCNEK
eukprot:GEMP01073955.1.p1 GENE.GEMP01073955.1~~GEMP01073955.1.p1  ORF type:complete len:133 (+),score=12.46 GEMP01073955.1:349-747(+)